MEFIKLKDRYVEYTFKQGTRSRKLWFSVSYKEGLVVGAPLTMRESTIEKFVQSHAEWILGKLEYFKTVEPPLLPKEKIGDYEKYKEAARILVHRRLEYFSELYGFRYNSVSIRNQKTRWGSCSAKGNLNFSYKIVLLTPALTDYIIVHEICHLKEMNHSKRFWALVVETVPNYHEMRKELHKMTNHH